MCIAALLGKLRLNVSMIIDKLCFNQISFVFKDVCINLLKLHILNILNHMEFLPSLYECTFIYLTEKRLFQCVIILIQILNRSLHSCGGIYRDFLFEGTY